MGMFDQFPYTNFHELNLEWILKALKEIEKTMSEFVAINSLKYADPIQWDITAQYEKNTIVIDPLTGTAYISVAPVPVGVLITNTDYWSVVFDLQQFVTGANENFTLNVEEQTTLNATFPTSLGGWVVWGGKLYRALTNIIAGDQYVENSNIERITVYQMIGNFEDLTTTAKTSVVDAINELVSGLATLDNKVDSVTGDLDNLTTSDHSNLVAAINEVLSDLNTTCGDLASLTTIDKTNLVAAINEVLTALNTVCGDLASLTTSDKTNLVAAINEVLATISTTVSGTVGNLSDLDTDNKDNIVDAINSQYMLHYLDGFRYYVDGVNGSDDNDGLTSATAFKTIERFLSIANSSTRGRSDIRCFILSAGLYDIGSNNEHVITGLALHITGSVPGVILNFLTAETIKFYTTHINFESLTIRVSDPSVTLSVDGGSFYFKQCTFECRLYMYAAMGHMEDCSCVSFLGEHSVMKILRTTITNTDQTVDAFYFRDCHIVISGDGSASELASLGINNSFITGVDSVLEILADPASLTNSYYYGLSAYRCIVRSSRRRFNRFTERSQAGVRNQGSAIFITNKTDTSNTETFQIWYNSFQHGLTDSIAIAAGAKTKIAVTYPQTFESDPNITASLFSETDPAAQEDLTLIVSSITASGFNVTICNNSENDTSIKVQWIGMTF